MDLSADDADPNGEAQGHGRSDAPGAGASASDHSNGDSADRNDKLVAPGGQGKNLRPAKDEFTNLEPFFERVEASAGRGPWPRLDSVMSHSSHAALALCVMGFAWAAGSHFFGAPTQSDAAKASAMQEVARREASESAELRRATQKMGEDLRAVKANLDSLRASIAQNQNSKDQHAFEKGLDGLKTRLDAVKTETSSAIAELASKVEHMQREPAAKLQQVVERLDRIEQRQTAAPQTTGSIPANAASGKTAAVNRPQILGAPPKLLEPPDGAKKPQLITSWVVRDVYDGVALVENASGSLEVGPGETIPGAGTVRSIERRGAGWIVITSRGLVDSAHDVYLP